MTEPVWLDGTQDLPPQPLLPDPLAGLLTGEVLVDAVPAPRVPAGPVAPPVNPEIRAALTEPAPRRKRRKQPPPPPPPAPRPVQRAFQPAPAYRPQVPRRQPKAKPGMSVISWLVILFILFLIGRSFIGNLTGH